jgi:5-methylcytosine-specific restriction endonuclease McrA
LRHLVTAGRTCARCGVTKPPEAFYRYRYKFGERFDSRCKECARARRKQRYAAVGDYERKVGRAYKSRNRDSLNRRLREQRAASPDFRLYRRASEAKRRAAAGDATPEDVRRVLEEARFGDRFLDAYTGELIDDPTIDHIVPLSRGGRHDYDNLCVTSRFNNTSKHNQSMLAWLARR